MNSDPHEYDLERSFEFEARLDRDFEREPDRTHVPRPHTRQFRYWAGMSFRRPAVIRRAA